MFAKLYADAYCEVEGNDTILKSAKKKLFEKFNFFVFSLFVEVVQGKSPWQIEQFGIVWQGNLWQI